MTSNFEFLKNKDKKLFNIIDDAEKLYRDGYFEQTMVQTRKFAENICKNTLGVRRTTEETFDDMLGTLSDILGQNPSDKEFIDDMYFLKKQGNLAAHGSAAEPDGNIALECLQRAFEVSINYAIKNKWANKKLLSSNYSIDLLMTGKQYKFSEKYEEKREEIDKEGIKELVKRAQKDDKKVLRADFKNKKKLPPKKEEEKIKPKKEKKEKKEKDKKEEKNKENLFPYILTGSILFILFVAIMLFILPI